MTGAHTNYHKLVKTPKRRNKSASMKPDYLTVVLAAFISGIIPAAILGMSHYVTKAWEWGNVARYTYGSFWVFTGLSGFILWYSGDWLLIGAAWFILGLSGLFVGGGYLFDEMQSRARQK